MTRQRRLIWDALVAEPDSHLSADDVVEFVRSSLPTLDRSTVYRTLDLLVRDGLVHRTHHGAGPALYEPVHEHAHHHVVCEGCGAVAHVHEADLGDLRTRIEQASGYVLSRKETVSLTGLCPACRGAAG